MRLIGVFASALFALAAHASEDIADQYPASPLYSNQSKSSRMCGRE